MRKIAVDTDVMIDFFQGQKQAADFVLSNRPSILISAVVVVELCAGFRGGDERSKIEEFIARARVIPLTAQIAMMAGFYLRQYSKSHGIGIADAIVAATAEEQNAELKTLNVRHYPMFEALKPAYRMAR
jgi:predicted nucleic acid-binding protein